jgi:acyl-CoA synthetase (NDP forming)
MKESPLVVDDLRPLLAPRSIAIVGASSSNPYASRLLENLGNGGFAGRLYLINPRQASIGDLPCHPSVEALPETPDLAIVVVPQRAVLDVLEACGHRGIPAALIISAGFGEAGDPGRTAQLEIRRIAGEHGMLVCGPNCLGIANTQAPAMMHSFTGLPVPRGNLALVSQSGAMAFASILSPACDRGVGFATVVSSGNEAVVDTVDYIRHFVRDPDVRVIASLLEGLRPGRGRAFLDVAAEAAAAGKPILVCKVGRSEVGARQVVSHTGSMTGSEAVYDAAFAQAGIIRVPDPDDLFEVASAFSRCPESQGEGLAILSTSGGLGVVLADKCGVHGLELPPLSAETAQRLAKGDLFLVVGDLGNPLDIRGQGAQHLPELLDLFIRDDRYHVLTVALGLPAVGDRAVRIARDLIDVAGQTDKPLIVLWMGSRLDPAGRASDQDGFRMLERSRVPVFSSPDKCFKALHALVGYHRFRQRRAPGGADGRRGTSPRPKGAGATAARAFLADKHGTLDEVDARKLLALYGIAGPREALAADTDAAARAAREIGYPVAVKVVSPDLPHKTDAGAVTLGVRDERALREACAAMLAAVARDRPDTRVHGLVVQEMIADGREMIVGASHDPQFGPVVTCGLGGVFVEVLRDVQRRIPPLGAEEARAMIAKLAGAATLGPFRGRPAVNVDAAVDVIRRVGQLALDLEDRIAEVEINPLMVTPAGAIAVDAVVALRTDDMGGPDMARLTDMGAEGGPQTPDARGAPAKPWREAGALLEKPREAQGADS